MFTETLSRYRSVVFSILYSSLFIVFELCWNWKALTARGARGRRSCPRWAATSEGVWPCLLANRRASLAPDCCSKKCVTRKRPRRAEKCSRVSWGFRSEEEKIQKIKHKSSERIKQHRERNRERLRRAAVRAATLWCGSWHTIACCSLATPRRRLIKPVQCPQWPSKQQTCTHLQNDKTTARLCLSSTVDQHTYLETNYCHFWIKAIIPIDLSYFLSL